MGQLLAQVVMPYKSGLPEDVAVNTFVFDSDADVDEQEASDVATVLEHFYTAMQTTERVAAYFSGCLDRTANACDIKMYNLTGHLGGGVMGSPIHVRQWTMIAQAAGGPYSFPEEVAVCMSLKTEHSRTSPEKVGDTRPAARGRGRLYLGPLNGALAGVDAQGCPLISAAARTNILDAAEDLANEVFGLAGLWRWVVWSRAGASVSEVEEVWVDDRFDTQRRRGMAPTTRTTRTVGPQ